MKDFKVCQQRVKKLERILARHNIREKDASSIVKDDRNYSTQIDDIEYMPLNQCLAYLKVSTQTCPYLPRTPRF